MAEEHRLGDIIDDYCSRCKVVMNHSVVALVEGAPARTECRTCYSAHKYRNARGGRKRPSTKEDLFAQVLSRMGPMGHR